MNKLNELLKGGVDPKWMIVLVGLIDIQKGIGAGAVSLTNMIPDGWIPHVTAWNSGLAWIGIQLVGVLAALSSSASGPLISVPNISLPSIDATKTVAKILIAAFVLSMFLAGNPATAGQLQLKKPAVTGDIIADVKTDLGIAPPAAGVTKNGDGTVTCNFNIFANLNPKNLLATIQACVSDVNSTFEPDVAAALVSAQAYGGSGDQTGIQCLQPALAIVQAGIARAAVAAVPAQPATPTSPAVPAVVAVAAYSPGAITLFQKFREFTLAGGPTACQNWVNGTIQGAVAPAVGAIAGVAGAAALGGL
jgi:hypothetical protein